MAVQQKNPNTAPASADVKKTASDGKKNVLKRGSLSVVYTIVFIALMIALNLVISSIAGSVNLTIDLTAEEDARAEEALYEGDEGDGSGFADNETAWE